MLFSFPAPRCEPGEALLSQTSSRPFYHYLDLDECGRRNKRAAASRKRGASPSSDGPRRPDTLSFVRAPGSAGAAPRAYAGPAPLSPADCPRWLGAARQGPRRKEAQGQPGAPASLDAPRLPRRAPPRYTRPCASPLVSGLPGLPLRLSPPGALFSSSQLFALCQELSSPCKHQAGLFQRPRNVSGA